MTDGRGRRGQSACCLYVAIVRILRRRRNARRFASSITRRPRPTRAPRPWSRAWSSTASCRCRMNTDCPTQTTPGRWMNPGCSYVVARPPRVVVFLRPKISRATRTETARSCPSTSYDRIHKSLSVMSIPYTRLHYSSFLGRWPKVFAESTVALSRGSRRSGGGQSASCLGVGTPSDGRSRGARGAPIGAGKKSQSACCLAPASSEDRRRRAAFLARKP